MGTMVFDWIVANTIILSGIIYISNDRYVGEVEMNKVQYMNDNIATSPKPQSMTLSAGSAVSAGVVKILQPVLNHR